jgi:hypothetical protein
MSGIASGIATGTRVLAGIGQSTSALASIISGQGNQPVVVLAGLALQAFEIPEVITAGTRQQMAVHRLPGGARVIDCMGADRDQITWSGVLLGAGCGARSRQIELLAGSGKQVSLVWQDNVSTVVVDRYSGSHRFGRVDYSISCTLLPPPPPAPTATPVAASQSGMANALTSISNGIQNVAGAVATAQQTIGAVAAVVTPITSALGINVPYLARASVALSEAGAAVGALSAANAGVASLSSAVSASQAASATMGGDIATADATIGGLQGVGSNGLGSVGLMTAINQTGQQANLVAAQAQTNVAIINMGGTLPSPSLPALGSDGAQGAVPAGIVARAQSPLANALTANPGAGVAYGSTIYGQSYTQ